MAVGDFEAYMPQEFDGAPYGRDGILRTMDEAGIDFSVVFPGGLPPDPRSINEELLTALKGDDRLLPGCLINPTLGPPAVDELRRCVGAGARSMKLMAAAHGYRLDGPAPDAVMAAAAELDLPVTIHSGSEVSGCSPAYIGTLASRHPRVTIIMDHMGYREWVGLAVRGGRRQPAHLPGHDPDRRGRADHHQEDHPGRPGGRRPHRLRQQRPQRRGGQRRARDPRPRPRRRGRGGRPRGQPGVDLRGLSRGRTLFRGIRHTL